jgi:response regulator of citrate/malate metabolism
MMWGIQLEAIAASEKPVEEVKKVAGIKPVTKEMKQAVLEQLELVREALRKAQDQTLTTRQVADITKLSLVDTRNRLKRLKEGGEVRTLARNSAFDTAIWKLK